MTKKIKNISILLVIIIFIGLVMRLWSINYGLPDIMYIDAQKTVGLSKKIALKILNGQWNIDPEKYQYPTFYINILAAEFVIYGLYYGLVNTYNGKFKTFKEAIYSLYMPTERGYLYKAVPSIFYSMARITSAIAGTLTILFTFLLASTAFKDRRIGLVAALFIALMFFHIKDSKYPMTDATMCLMGVIGAYYLAKISIESTLKNYILAGAFIGLGASTKYFPIFYTIPFGLIIIKDWIDERIKDRKNLYKKIVIGLSMILIFFIIGTPIFLVRYSNYLGFTNLQMQVQRKGKVGYTQNWYFDYLFNTYPINNELFSTNGLWSAMGIPILILLLIGIIYSLYMVFSNKSNNKWIDLGLTLMVILFYIFMAGEGKKRIIRYFYFCYPIYAVIAARFLTDISDIIFKNFNNQKRNLVLCFFAIIFVLPTSIRTIRFNYIRSFPDTRISAGKWIEENIPYGSKIFMPILYPPIISSAKYKIGHYRGGGGEMKKFVPIVEQIKLAGFEYIITSSYDTIIFYSPDTLREHPKLALNWRSFFRSLDEKAELINKFENNKINKPGPEIRIYKI
jgi:hypothetical protein